MMALKSALRKMLHSAPENKERFFIRPTARQGRESGEMTIICRRRRKESLIFDLSLVTSTPTNLVAVRKNLDWFGFGSAKMSRRRRCSKA
jgi:hypothetical protein